MGACDEKGEGGKAMAMGIRVAGDEDGAMDSGATGYDDDDDDDGDGNGAMGSGATGYDDDDDDNGDGQRRQTGCSQMAS